MVAFMGGFDIDLRDADIEGNEATITVNALMGGGVIRVPDWAVSMRVAAFMGGHSLKAREGPQPMKTLVVKGMAIMGGVEFVTETGQCIPYFSGVGNADCTCWRGFRWPESGLSAGRRRRAVCPRPRPSPFRCVWCMPLSAWLHGIPAAPRRWKGQFPELFDAP